MDPDTQTGIKRKWSPALQKFKRQCVDQADVESHINVVDLSDCILVQILQFLDATSLYQMGKTCTRFHNLVQDALFWINVDARKEPNNDDKLSFCWKNINRRTKRLFLAAKRRSDFIISLKKFTPGNLPNLTVLALEHQCIKYCKLKEFPSTLEELSFRHSFIARHVNFFRLSDKTMCNLKTLILDHCQWLETECLQSFSKYPKLEILSLYMCRKLTEEDISIISIAGMMGFKSLKVVDLRFTGLGDLFIKSFYKNTSLQSIYLQCLTSSYYLDRYARKLNIINGAKMNENAYVSDDEDNNDMSRRSLYDRFKTSSVVCYATQVMRDDTCSVFNRVNKNTGRKLRPKSHLYRYPYEECRCGFLNKNSSSCDLDVKVEPNCTFSAINDGTSSWEHEQHSSWDSEMLKSKYFTEVEKQKINCSLMNPQFLYSILPNKDSVCCKVVYDSCTLPSWCQIQSVPDNVFHKWLYIREPKNDYEISMLEHADKHMQARVIRRCNGKSAECICLGCYKECSNIIIITREADGTFTHSNRSVESPTPNGSNRNYYEHEYTDYLIDEFANCMSSLQNRPSKNLEDLSVVQDFIISVNDCLLKTSILELNTDIGFLKELHKLFFQIARHTKQDMKVVLQYHFTCFEDLLTHLEADDIPIKKNILIRFFDNLVASETQNYNENCNLPGPSGLQPSLDLYESKPPKNAVMSEAGMLIRRLLSNPSNNDGENESERKGHKRIILKRRSLLSLVRREPFEMEGALVDRKLNEQTGTNIQELSFRGYYYVTDNTLKHLKKMELTLLDVTGTNVTSEGIRNFLMYNPECQLIHEEACTCKPSLHF